MQNDDKNYYKIFETMQKCAPFIFEECYASAIEKNLKEITEIFKKIIDEEVENVK